VNSTPGDLFLWDQSLYTEKLVKINTLNEAFSPTRLNDGAIHEYGFGWGIAKDSVLENLFTTAADGPVMQPTSGDTLIERLPYRAEQQ